MFICSRIKKAKAEDLKCLEICFHFFVGKERPSCAPRRASKTFFEGDEEVENSTPPLSPAVIPDS
jgi:hypothetical protein